eukprot:CFRG8430T1
MTTETRKSCPACARTYEDETPYMLQCESCYKWIHHRCLGIDSANYKVLESEEALHLELYCPNCIVEEDTIARRKKNKELFEFACADPAFTRAFNAQTSNLMPGEKPGEVVANMIEKELGAEKGLKVHVQQKGKDGLVSPVVSGPKITLTVSEHPKSTSKDFHPDSVSMSGEKRISARPPSSSVRPLPQRRYNNDIMFPVKPADSYFLFKTALESANPGIDHEDLKLLALHEWSLISNSDRRRYQTSATKAKEKFLSFNRDPKGVVTRGSSREDRHLSSRRSRNTSPRSSPKPKRQRRK